MRDVIFECFRIFFLVRRDGSKQEVCMRGVIKYPHKILAAVVLIAAIVVCVGYVFSVSPYKKENPETLKDNIPHLSVFFIK
jgi:hypothetical protein